MVEALAVMVRNERGGGRFGRDSGRQERCTMQLVQIVAMNVKFRSNQEMEDQFIVTIVSKTDKN